MLESAHNDVKKSSYKYVYGSKNEKSNPKKKKQIIRVFWTLVKEQTFCRTKVSGGKERENTAGKKKKGWQFPSLSQRLKYRLKKPRKPQTGYMQRKLHPGARGQTAENQI